MSTLLELLSPIDPPPQMQANLEADGVAAAQYYAGQVSVDAGEIQNHLPPDATTSDLQARNVAT